MTYSQAKDKFKKIERELENLLWAQSPDTEERRLHLIDFPKDTDIEIKEKFIKKFHEGLEIRQILFKLTGRHQTPQ